MKYLRWLALVVAASVVLGGSSASAAVNDFEITNYHMKLELGRDEERRSTLTTSETITAQFPQTDQNRGIERAVPTNYNGHSVRMKVQSVTDQHGNNLSYSTYTSDDNTVIRIGDKDTYVHGLQTYKLTYTQRDVTQRYDDTGKDEFYWDLNGVDWRVPIREFSAEILPGADLSAHIQQSACYQGKSGSEQQCSLSEEGGVYRVAANNLGAGDNVTVALGFAQGTFAEYEPSIWERLLPWWIGVSAASGVGSFMVMLWAAYRGSKLKNRAAEMGTIVPEYLPPKDASVTAAAEVIDYPGAIMAAQLIDLAVRHYLRIIETKKKSMWANAEYTLEIIKDPSSLRDEEQELLRDLFDTKTLTVGQRLEMKKLEKSTTLYTRLQDNPGKLSALVRGDYGLREKGEDRRQWFTKTAKYVAIFGAVTLSPLSLLMAGSIWLIGKTLWPLTDKGLALRRYLLGLKLYIGVAEADRLKMLQSPEGAEKVGVDSAESSESIVKLYEKVLPYAVLFGQEKQWGKQLGAYYESTGTSPDWYTGTQIGAFNAVALLSALSSFNAAASSSSTSGGSSGGGSSGGGGGGGGGGGW